MYISLQKTQVLKSEQQLNNCLDAKLRPM